jgi:RNA polymerase sigma factor for flagellar operon FliA
MTTNATSADLAQRMMPSVHRLARKLARRLPAHVQLSDLVSAGALGLAEAIARTDPAQHEAFVAFAECRIRGAMLDELRSHDPLSRDERAQTRRIASTVHALTVRLGRTPDAAEIAAELGVTLESYWKMNGASTTVVRSLDDESAPIQVDREEEPVDDVLSRAQRTRAVRQAINSLPARLRRVLDLHHEGLTLREIGQELGVTESRASQLRTEAIRNLREACSGHLESAAPERLAA